MRDRKIGGRLHFLHPSRISQKLERESEKNVALLYGVLEDSKDFTMENLHFFKTEGKKALNLLTHTESDEYFTYVKKTKNHPFARRIKLKDLELKMNVGRSPTLNKDGFRTGE